MAYWNAPLPVPDHAERACRAALAMLAEVEKVNQSNAATAAATGHALPNIKIGIGLNTGLCCVGNMGADQRFDYSAIGDPVNVASRLEGETKGYGVPIMIGETTAQSVPHFAILELGSIRVRGRVGESKVFALLGDETRAAAAEFAALRAVNDRYLGCIAAGDTAGALAAIAEGRSQTAFKLPALWDRREAEATELLGRAQAPAEPDGRRGLELSGRPSAAA
jgi:adenylate cyclase